MREMKDSGIEWIANIPEHWSVTKIGNIYSLRVTKVSDRDYPPLSVTNKGIFPQLETVAKTNAHNDRKLVCKGDFAINSRSDRRGSCGISSYTGSVSLINTILCPMMEMNPQYYDWLFHTIQFGDEFYKWGHGIVDDLWTTSWQDMKKITIPTPPIEEQKVIAEYLDDKCAEIDSLISDIQQQIETLELYKRSVITEAVTKGLDPDVEMRDSGIEWIRNIPKHWIIHPLYCYFGERKNKNALGIETNLLSLSYGNIIRKDINSNGGLLPESFNTYNIIEENDIIIRPTDLQNDKRSLRTGIAREHGIITSAYIAMKAIKPVNPEYFHYLLNTYDVMKVFYNMGNGVRQGLNFSEFSRLIVFEPTIKEQNAIVSFLKDKCSEIDLAIAEKKQQIETIEEYKKSLIFEYVTGKKEVSFSQQLITIHPVVLAAIVIDELGKDLLGKIKLQKGIILCDLMLGLRPNAQYYRYEHGPYDKELENYLKKLNDSKWFIIKNGSPMECYKGKNYLKYEKRYEDVISEYAPKMKKILDFIRPMKTSEAERVATLFAVWNDMIIDGVIAPTDNQIIEEVITAWTPNKANPKISTWQNTLDKMKNKGIIPIGFGKHTKHK